MLMRMAEAARERGTCLRRHVGVVIAIDGRPLVSGYNGAAPGEEHCTPDNCRPDQPCTRSRHAERNAILWAARKGLALEGATLYTTVSPCQDCAEMIVMAGIGLVVYRELYRDTSPISYLSSRGVGIELCPA